VKSHNIGAPEFWGTKKVLTTFRPFWRMPYLRFKQNQAWTLSANAGNTAIVFRGFRSSRLSHRNLCPRQLQIPW